MHSCKSESMDVYIYIDVRICVWLSTYVYDLNIVYIQPTIIYDWMDIYK